MCVLVLVHVCVCGNSGPLFCQHHTGSVFMTVCNSEGCVVDPHLFKRYSSVVRRFSKLLAFALVVWRDVCPVYVAASWMFNVITGTEGVESLALCLCVSV